VSDEHEPLAREVLRLRPASVSGTGASVEDSKASSSRCQSKYKELYDECVKLDRKVYGSAKQPVNLRRAARSSGEAFFLTSCNRRMAVSRSTCVLFETKDILEPCSSVSLVVDPCLLPKHDNELDLELVLEFDLEITEEGRPRARGASSPTASSSLFDHAAFPCSESTGERSVSLICCRPFALKSAYLEVTDTGDSTTSAGPDEFVLVLGFDNRLWWLGELWLLPMF